MTFDWYRPNPHQAVVEREQQRLAAERADTEHWWATQPERIAARLGLTEAP